MFALARRGEADRSARAAVVPDPAPLGALQRDGASLSGRSREAPSSARRSSSPTATCSDELWESVVIYHQDARDTPAVVDNTHELADVPQLADAVRVARRRRARSHRIRSSPTAARAGLGALALGRALLAFLAYHRPLHDNHLLLLPVVLAVPAGIALGALACGAPRQDLAVAVLALVLAAGYVQQQRRVVLDDVPEEPELVAAAETLRRVTGPDDLVVSDHSIVPFLADRRVPGPLVDTARLRFETGSLTEADVLRELDAWDVKAVVVGRAFSEQPELLRALAREYPKKLRVADLTIFLRSN